MFMYALVHSIQTMFVFKTLYCVFSYPRLRVIGSETRPVHSVSLEQIQIIHNFKSQQICVVRLSLLFSCENHNFINEYVCRVLFDVCLVSQTNLKVMECFGRAV